MSVAQQDYSMLLGGAAGKAILLEFGGNGPSDLSDRPDLFCKNAGSGGCPSQIWYSVVECRRPAGLGTVPIYRLHDNSGDDLGTVEHLAPNLGPGDVVVLADGREARS